MEKTRTPPAGPKAFRLYTMVRDPYRYEIGERAFTKSSKAADEEDDD